MIRFYTREFFEELARQLNGDEAWRRSVKDVHLRILCTAADLRRSFLLTIEGGQVTASEAPAGQPSDFRFEGVYDSWVKLCKGEAELDRLVQTGKIRVAGSLPELMGRMGALNHIVLVARRFPKEF